MMAQFRNTLNIYIKNIK